ncbi:response regulator [Thalassomonas actiniarum]|uniref:Response regulator n=1 Tax=Thalassomonas actiniarum TaxID=485447 RepID=A0AAE9YSF9_9GAMM|nr:response regulator [Thalassomonas actiniarum]WDD99882.1 response regulator [Thalassomonas actiniarum]
MTSSVLICDDSNMARKQVVRSLPSHWPVEVQTAKNGIEALEVLRKQAVDVLFLDLTMPELDGLGVLQKIKEEGITCSVFVISADVQPAMQAKVLELGATAFLRKPVEAEVLMDELQVHGFL